MTSNHIRGRFAPSPSGRLHLGNLLSSLLAWLDVKSLGGEMLFRLEDLDPDRSHREYSKWMADDLDWLGLNWDLGWMPNGNEAYAQSNRSALYSAAFRNFEEQGLVYPCFCSRAQRLAASAPHPGELRECGCGCMKLEPHQIMENLQNGRKPSYKIHVPDRTILFQDGHYGQQEFHLISGQDDFIVRRADGVFAYQFAVSYDDAVMGVSRVVRGNDLLDSSPKQIWLIQQLGYEPPFYCHAPLLVVDDGRKMSKRNGDLSMEQLRKSHTPEQLCGQLAYLAGILARPEPCTPKDLISVFDWALVPKENVVLPEQLI